MPKLLTSILLLAAGLVASSAQTAFQPDTQYVNEFNNARARLQSQAPKLTKEELDQLAATLARSNRLAEIIPNLIFQYNLTNAAELLKEFPGTIDDLQRYGQPLLSGAVNEGASVIFDFLLEHKARPEPVNPDAESHLIRALQYRRFDMAVKLILAGASVTRTNQGGQNPAAVFFESWHPGNTPDPSVSFLVPQLLARGLDPFIPIRPGAQNSILEECLARESGYSGGLRRGVTTSPVLFGELLLTNNPSPARRTPLGDTAIHLAARWEYTNVIRFLLTNGFTLDQTNALGLTPLQGIVGSGAGSMVSNRYYRAPVVLVSNVPGPAGPARPFAPTPTITDWLLDHGAALDVFSAAGLGLTNELAALLRTNAALANTRDGYGRTPLHYVVLNAVSYPGFAYSFSSFGIRGGWGGPWNGPFSSQSFSIASGLPQGVTMQIPSVTNAPPAAIVMLLAAGADPAAATTNTVPQQRNATLLPTGSTPLHIAARNGNTAVVRLLLNSRASAKAADADGNTPLHLVARTWQTNAIPMLLTARASLELTNLAGQTPLRAAVESGVSTGVDVLLDAGANPTNGLGETTLMHLAAERGDVGTLTVLLQHNLALESRDRAGRTPLQKAIAAKNWNSITFLQGRGANLQATNYAGDTALHLIAAQQEDGVHRLPDEPTLVRWQRSQLGRPGWTGRALNWLMTSKVLSPLPALMWTNTSLSTWLIERGVEVNATNRAGQTPLHALCSAEWTRWYGSSQSSNRITRLLNAGASLDSLDTNGFTPLHVAATNQSPQLFRLLLAKAGPRVNQADKQGRTMLHRAVENTHDNFERVTALLAVGADPNLMDHQGLTPLHVAVQFKNDGYYWQRRNLVLTLLTNGANPNLTDHNGRTPLNAAFAELANNDFWYRQEVITTLLTNRADPNLADHDGNTPLHRMFQAFATNYNLSSMRGSLEVLFKQRANPALTNCAGLTPLHIIARPAQPNYHTLELVKTYVSETNAAFAVPAPNGDTPLHLWARSLPNCYSCSEFFGKLLAFGTHAALVNAAGETPITLQLTNVSAPWTSRALTLGVNPAMLASVDRNGDPMFHRMLATLAMGYGENQQWLRRMLTNKALVNLTNAAGDTPLHIALRRRDSWLPRMLLEAGADPLLKNACGESPLRLSAMNYPNGPVYAAPAGARMPYFAALRSRNEAEANRWLEADPGLATITNRDGITPIMAASEARNMKLVDRLLAMGATLDALSALRLGRMEEFRALLPQVPRPLPGTWAFEAVRFGRLEGLQLLVAAGIDIQSTDSDGASLLYCAADNPQFAAWLTAQGCRLTFFDAIAQNDSAAVTAALDADKSLLDQPNRNGRLPLIRAVAFGKTEMVALLLARGAKVDAQASEGWNALHLAAANDSADIARLLLAAGVATNARTSSSLSPLDVAAIYGATNTAELLIRTGALVSAQPEHGFRNTPLHWAVHMGRLGMVKLLLAHGADLTLKNNRSQGETPLDLSRLQVNSIGMGLGVAAELGRGYPDRNRPEEERAAIVKALAEPAEPRAP